MNNNTKLKLLSFALVLLSFFFSNRISATETDSLNIANDEIVKIDSIKITGNKTTQEFIILRELTFQEGDKVSGKILRFNRERIFSLRLFTNVKFYVNSINGLNTLAIDVKESWYIYPVPIFRAQGSSLSKLTYGVNLVYKNFRGRNETVRAMFGFGYDPFYNLLYDNPALIFKDDIGLQVGITYSNFKNRSATAAFLSGVDFKYKFYSNQISISKRFNQFNLAFLTVGFNYSEFPFSGVKGIMASDQRIDRAPIGGLSYYYDSRDLKQFSENGLFAYFSFMHKGFGVNDINYNVINFDFREYRKIIGNLSGKWRVSYRTTFGKVVPLYDYSLLGYSEERVRGHLDDIREGKNSLLTSLEFSYPIIHEWDISIKLPLLPESLTSARVGIYLSGFFDAGSAFQNENYLSFNDFYSGYGFGITFLVLPYNAIRFEFAINEFGKGEFLIGTGFSF